MERSEFNMQRSSPAITVVMAAYNAEAYIARAIGSVQAQSFQDWELICIDDGSTDSTQHIIRSFASKDGRIKIISQDNAGPAEARRKGYIAGAGKYFTMLDSDDWLGTDALEKLYLESQETQADCVTCRVMLKDAQSEHWVSFHEQRGTEQGKYLTGREAFALTFPWRINANGALYSEEIIKAVAVDPRNAFNRFNADEYLTRKLFLHCRAIFIGSGEYFKYPNQGSITKIRSWKQFLALETDRRLTDLAVAAGVDSEVMHTVLEHQRKHLIGYIGRFARYGGDGKAGIVMREIHKSFLHYLRVKSTMDGRFSDISIIFPITKHALRSFLGRFAVLRNIYHKIRPAS
jgi:glycosyltransferase involved in cell wall biosynthesis